MSTGERDSSEDAGPSKKRRIDQHENGKEEYDLAQSTSHSRIAPSMFGMSARNEFTKTIGEFIMANAFGKEHVEVGSVIGPYTRPRLTLD